MNRLAAPKGQLRTSSHPARRIQPLGTRSTAALLHPTCGSQPAIILGLNAAPCASHSSFRRRTMIRGFAVTKSTTAVDSGSNSSGGSSSANRCTTTLPAHFSTAPDDAAASTAIVLGSGMCGLAAALALAPSFDRVLLLEADTPEECWAGTAEEAAQVPGQPRPGVAQYRFMHALLSRGARELEQLCPGYLQELQARGANMTDYYQDLRFGTPAGPFARVTSPRKPLPIVQASRHLLEQTLRGFVQRHPKVHIMYGAEATGLTFADCSSNSSETVGSAGTVASSSRRVVGVQLAGGRVLRGDLVVAAAGRRAKLAEWLQQGGWPAAPVTSVDVNSAYTTWFLRMPPDVEQQLPFSGVYHSANPPDTAAGAYLQRDEGGLWVVAGISFDRKAPMPTLDSALSWMKQVVYADEVHSLVSRATPVSPVRTIGGLNNTWTHYEQVLPPDGLIVLGDAYCNLNPIYGQGMTVAAIEASLLGQLLAQRIAQQLPANAAGNSSSTTSAADTAAAAERAAVAAAVVGLGAEFYPAAAAVVGASWAFAAGRDMLYPFAAVRGEARSLGWRLMQEYVGAIFKLAAVDAETSEAVGGAMNMAEEPSVLFKPSIVAKVAAHTLLGWPWRSNSWSSSSSSNWGGATKASSRSGAAAMTTSASNSNAQNAAEDAALAKVPVGVREVLPK